MAETYADEVVEQPAEVPPAEPVDRVQQDREAQRQRQLDERAEAEQVLAEERQALLEQFNALDEEQRAEFIAKALVYFGLPVPRDAEIQGYESSVNPLARGRPRQIASHPGGSSQAPFGIVEAESQSIESEATDPQQA